MAYSAEREFDEDSLGALISNEIRTALNWSETELSGARQRNLEYLRGEMTDTPPRPNGSSVTSRDLADTISWMLPGIMRVFMASDNMAEYEPTITEGADMPAAEKAEENARQASDYIQYVFMKDNPGYRNVYNATFDALLAGDGVVKYWWDETPETEITIHSRLTVEQVAQLTEADGVEVLAQEKNREPDIVADPMTGQPVPVETYNVKIERVTSRGRIQIRALPPENFIVDDGVVALEDTWRFVAHRDPYKTRSDLVEMGFDREKVDELAGDTTFLDDAEALARRDNTGLTNYSSLRSQQRVDLYECYLRVDVDNDGVAETVRVYYAGDAGAGTVLDWDVWEDDLPFATIPCYPQPHRFDSESVADRTTDIQKIKTILQRGSLDNIYAANLPMREVEANSVLNPDILVSPKFGGIIWKKANSTPIVSHETPFVADKMVAGIKYFDSVLERRTGVSRMSMALDPESLQNQSATANQNAHDASYSQIELVARNMAELGWRRVFRSLLRLTVKHQDRPRIIRLRGKFVEMDPRVWNSNMDVTVNVGLGSGSRDRDMSMLRLVLGDQISLTDRLSTAGFDKEALAMLPRIRNTEIKIAEAAGLRNADQFWPDIDSNKIGEMAQQAAQKRQQPPIELQREQIRGQVAVQVKQAELQAQAAADEKRLQLDQQAEILKAQGNQAKEQAQLQADLQTKEADRQTQLMMQQQAQQFEWQKLAEELAFRREELATKTALEMRKIEEARDAREAAAQQPANSQGGGSPEPAGE